MRARGVVDHAIGTRVTGETHGLNTQEMPCKSATQDYEN